MARTEHHGAYGFLIYYIIWMIFFGNGDWIMPRYLTFLVVLCGMLPDADALYYLAKNRGKKIDTEFQHHLFYWTHWPISYFPLIIIFIISVILNFYPEYFLAPVVGIYCGHFLFDSLSCGDGIMWGKIPWKKGQYAPYINLLKGKCDGYHGSYWEVRYRKSFIGQIGNFATAASLFIITIHYVLLILQVISPTDPAISGYYIMPMIIFIFALSFSSKRIPEEYSKEPPEGRYADYRINPEYINGLSEKNQKKHIEKYKTLLKDKGVMEKIILK
ncbi:MAG: hypothetical protein ACTSR8_00730 [Promethearchaeota archaeon]